MVMHSFKSRLAQKHPPSYQFASIFQSALGNVRRHDSPLPFFSPFFFLINRSPHPTKVRGTNSSRYQNSTQPRRWREGFGSSPFFEVLGADVITNAEMNNWRGIVRKLITIRARARITIHTSSHKYKLNEEKPKSQRQGNRPLSVAVCGAYTTCLSHTRCLSVVTGCLAAEGARGGRGVKGERIDDTDPGFRPNGSQGTASFERRWWGATTGSMS